MKFSLASITDIHSLTPCTVIQDFNSIQHTTEDLSLFLCEKINQVMDFSVASLNDCDIKLFHLCNRYVSGLVCFHAFYSQNAYSMGDKYRQELKVVFL